MKLFIQIPCFNEEGTLGAVIRDLPRKINGIDEIKILVIDDGSSDKTVDAAKKLGVDYIIRNGRNLGLSRSFSRGIEACLFLGADIIVNTDGDNQYQGQDIPKLINPILKNQADIVIGCRDIDNHKEFSSFKKFLQKAGSKIVSSLSETNIPDTTSGFRAIGRAAAVKISLMNSFSYTLEMLIQASRIGSKITWVPIRTNPKLRESRLFKSIPSFIYQQLKVLLSVNIFYKPILFFGTLAFLSFLITALLSVRIAYYLWLVGPGEFKFKIGTGILLTFTSSMIVIFFAAGLLGAVLSGLRFYLIDIRSRIRNLELDRRTMPLNFKILASDSPASWTRTNNKTPVYRQYEKQM